MNAFDQDILQAVRLQNAGRLGDAEEIYRRILQSEPGHPQALHLLGVIALQFGQPAAAEELVRRALEGKPDFPEALKNLGKVLVEQEKYAAAIEAYQKLVKLRPVDAKGWYSLAVTLRLNLCYLEAVQAAQRAVELDPAFGEAYLELGDLHRLLKNAGESIAVCRRAIELLPQVSNGFNSLGNALYDVEQFDDAIGAYQRAIELEPENSNYLFNLGTVLARAGRFEDALAPLDNALKLDPDNAIAHSTRGAALAGLLRFDEAVAAHLRAVQLSPEMAPLHHALGECYRSVRENKLAEAAFERALQIDGKLTLAWIRLGEANLMDGNFDSAVEKFTKALEFDPQNTSAFKHLSTVGKLKSDKEVDHLRALLNGGGLNVKDQIMAGFALGKLLDERDEFDEAFLRYAQANRLFREHSLSDTTRFDGSKLIRSVDEKVEAFSSDFFHARRDWGVASQLPVFVVGMPRSGTTLVEQIAASHPEVFGAGERSEIRYYAEHLGAPAAWSRERVDHFADEHLKVLASLSPGSARIVDKMPGNIMYLGVIGTLFPKAKIVVCKRNAIDNCLSCFFQRFAKDNLSFSYDLLDCATQSLAQDRMLEHWKKVLPNPVMIMQYEEMVADQEKQSRRLIDFLGLPWDPACLEFYNTRRAVITASMWQVRQPIYTGSVDRWRNYEKQLGPLISALRI